jgi:hypothetical protein
MVNMPAAICKNRGKLGRETDSRAHTEKYMRKNGKTKQVSRRKLLGQALAIPAMAAAAQAADSATPARGSRSWREVRRVVTSYDAAGRTVILQDGAPTNSFEMSGTKITRLWESSGLPVSLPLGPDLGATAGNAYRDGFAGTSFYIAELPGGTRSPSIPLHSNATLDYMAILSGKVAFKLDQDRELILKAGDTLVQGGNLHTWVNRWRESCLLLFVVVTGQGKRPG